jgi:hypothetical protein
MMSNERKTHSFPFLVGIENHNVCLADSDADSLFVVVLPAQAFGSVQSLSAYQYYLFGARTVRRVKAWERKLTSLSLILSYMSSQPALPLVILKLFPNKVGRCLFGQNSPTHHGHAFRRIDTLIVSIPRSTRLVESWRIVLRVRRSLNGMVEAN